MSPIKTMTDAITTPAAPAAHDEAFDGDGLPRPAYRPLFERFGPEALAAEGERIRAELEGGRVTFGADPGRPFIVDAVPRIISAEEWDPLERGLIQRTRALNAFLEDVYGERRIVAAGLLRAELIESAEWFEPAMRDAEMPRVIAHVAGPDLVRGSDGELRVLEDNMRAPSGIAYAGAARAAVGPMAKACGLLPRPVEAGIEALGRMLAAAAPEDGRVVLVGDGEGASARFEHLELAATLGIEIATAEELDGDGERLFLGGSPVDVVYRRVDDERLTDPDGRPTRLGELLGDPMRSGTLACVNSPGSGVADDKAIHTHVEEMIPFYLGEDPILRSVPGRWLGDEGEAETALERLGELVLKPRSEFGGSGVVIGPAASAAELADVAQAVAADPGAWVAQEPVALSLHPTVVGDRLERRHVDLRPFVITTPGDEGGEDEMTVVPGGLTRFARAADSMMVNSGQGGGAKDTWVL